MCVRRFSRVAVDQYLGLAVLILASACGSGPEAGIPKEELSATRLDSADIRILSLSHTLAEVADGATRADTVAPDLLVGAAEGDEGVWFGSVADVTSLGGGSFAVLDHMQSQIVLIDSVGRSSATLGREGEGPGEFRWPWALATVGSALVVRQVSPIRAFTIFNPDGTIRGTGPANPEGDWGNPMFRQPDVRIRGFQMGPEDVTRRLLPFDTGSFVHLLQADEYAEMDFEDPLEFEVSPTFLIRYDLDGRLIDTLATLSGPPTLVQEIWRGQTIFYTQPVFSARPIWATGDGWYAISHGDSTEVVVRTTAGRQMLRIRYPARRRAVSDEDRRTFANWGIVSTFNDSPSSVENARQRGAAVLAQLQDWWSTAWRFADSIPTVTAAYGAGKCLFLSGYRPADWFDGTSLTWVVIDVEEGRVLSTLRLRPPEEGSLPRDRMFAKYVEQGAAVRDFDGEFAFTFRRMSDDVPAVERFPLGLPCGH